MTNISPLLYCVKLTKFYWHTNSLIKILNGINLSIQSHEIIAIVGPSGSGKTTLLHLLGGLDQPTSGEIFFEGNAFHELNNKSIAFIRNKRIGLIYQFHHLLSDFNILDNVAMPLLIGGKNFNYSKTKAKHMLTLVGLKNYINYYPHQLSGGQKQRVSIARSIINCPSLILADEPTGNLDQENSNKIFQILQILNQRYGTAFVIATHDTSLANKCHKILIIYNGNLKSDLYHASKI